MSTNPSEWMQKNLRIIGSLPLGNVCFPYSHDAGMWTVTSSTKFASENTLCTQSHSIYDQLNYGIRWFDIRPMMSENKWFCGHYHDTELPFVGRQGGNGQSLDDVISDVNRFTDQHSELVIIDISGAYNNDTEKYLVDADLDKLLLQLSSIHHIYRASDPKNVQLANHPVNHYISGNKPCVLVIFGGDLQYDIDKLASYSFYTRDNQFPRRDYGKLVLMQSTAQVISSTVALNKDSVLNLSRAHVPRELPFVLQDIACDINYTNTLTFDDIHNIDPITLSLAVTCYRCNALNNIVDPVIVYGGSVIDSLPVRSAILAAVAKGEDFVVSNAALGGDPLVDVVKSCAVYYSTGGVLKGRFALEKESLNFSKDIDKIFYGPAGTAMPNTKKVAYYNLYRALVLGKYFTVNNTTMDVLNDDPAPGVPKVCTIEYREPEQKKRTADEDMGFDFTPLDEEL